MRLFLLAEFCGHDLFHGWHLYLRESKDKHRQNEGKTRYTGFDWGWSHKWFWETEALRLVRAAGCIAVGHPNCDDGPFAEMAKRFPIPRERIWKKPRGCIEVILEEDKGLRLASEVRR